MKIIWKCSEVKLKNVLGKEKKYEYTIYNEVNKIEISCTSNRSKKEIEESISITLRRMNNGKIMKNGKREW